MSGQTVQIAPPGGPVKDGRAVCDRLGSDSDSRDYAVAVSRLDKPLSLDRPRPSDRSRQRVKPTRSEEGLGSSGHVHSIKTASEHQAFLYHTTRGLSTSPSDATPVVVAIWAMQYIF